MRKLTVIIFTALILSGCKVAVIVAEGGKVVTGSGSACLAGSVCRYAATDTSYADTFTAVPDDGWAFAGWSEGSKRFCSHETSNLCTLDASLAAGTTLEEEIASNNTWYLEPVFTCISADCAAVTPPTPAVTSDLSDAKLVKAQLTGSTLAGVALARANLKRANLSDADLSDADLSEANLNRAVLVSAALAGALMVDANLKQADLTGADLSGADLSGAKLRGVIWSNTTCPDGSNSDSNVNCGL